MKYNYKITWLTLRLVPHRPVDCEQFYNGILAFLGFLFANKGDFKEATRKCFYDRIMFYKGISIKIPKSDLSAKQGFSIEFSGEGIQTYIDMFGESSFRKILYDFYDTYSDTCLCSCSRIDILTDYAPYYIKS